MKRIDYIDTAKGYLMLAVILGHILIVLNPDYSKLYFTSVEAFIYAFHMPAFFVIHGILFDVEKWRKKPLKGLVIKRLRTLIIPYVFFEVIGIIWRAFFYKQSLWNGIYNLLTIRCNIGADWFLPAMFLGSLLFMIYVKHPNKIYAVFSTVICFLIPMIMNGHQLFIVAGRALLAYGFIMIGSLLKSLFLSEKIKGLSCIGVSLFITALSAIIGLKWGNNDFYTCSISNPLIFAVGGISGTVMILGISQIMNIRIVSNYIGKYTLSIMGTHQLAIYMMTAVAPALTGGSVICGLLLLVVIFVFEVPVVWFIERYFGYFIGRGFKKRTIIPHGSNIGSP